MVNKEDQQQSLTGLYGKMWKHPQGVIQVIILQLIWSFLTLLFPFLTQIIVDQGISYQDLNIIQIALLGMIMLFIGSTVADFFKNWLLRHLGVRLNLDIVKNYMNHLISHGLLYIGNKKEGDILQSFNENFKIEQFLTTHTANLIDVVVKLLLFGGVLFVFDLRVGLVFVGALLALMAWTFAFLPTRKKLDDMRFAAQSRSRTQLIEIFNGIADIKVNNLEYPQMNLWHDAHDNLSQFRLKLLQVAQLVRGGTYFINHLKDIFILYFTSLSVMDGSLTLGTLLAVLYIIGQLNQPMSDSSIVFGYWLDAKLSLDRIQQFSGSMAEDYQPAKDYPTLHIQEEVLVKNLEFSYQPGQPVLKKINIDIPYGKKIAIVGESGSGKSTFIKLLLGLFEQNKGTIKLGYQDLRNINEKSWRNSISTVLQEGYVFRGSIKHNITLGVDSEIIDYDLLQKAIEVSCLEEVIQNLDKGVSTVLGKGGQGLSKGQAQRVLLARAIYKNGHYLIMDEPTSALDNMTSRNVIKNVSQFFEDRSIIVATHKLPIAEYFDYVFLFKNGAIVEQGTHTELMARESDYYELYNSFLKIQ